MVDILHSILAPEPCWASNVCDASSVRVKASMSSPTAPRRIVTDNYLVEDASGWLMRRMLCRSRRILLWHRTISAFRRRFSD